MSAVEHFRLTKQETGIFLLSTYNPVRARELALSIAVAFRKSIAISRVVTEGTRSETELFGVAIYRKLMHEEHAYMDGE